jgi:threonine/homoserine/homoserine lactone efflux protein
MPELVPALLLFLLPLAYSPGPGNLFFAATGARFGLAATAPRATGR